MEKIRKNKKEDILNAAVDVFFEKGYGSASTAEIAAKAGVAEGTVFRHFNTKKELLLQVLERFIEKFAENIVIKPLHEIIEKNSDRSIDEILTIITKDRMALFEENADLAWIIISEMRYHPELRHEVYEHMIKKAFPLFSGIFEDGMKRGLFRETDPSVAARSFLGALLLAMLQRKVFPQMSPEDLSVDKDVEETIGIFLRGILKENEVGQCEN